MNKRGFMLLELVLALGLSSVIMFGFMQVNRSLQQFVSKSRESFVADRKVCLLFNQLERDISSANIPVLAPKQAQADEGKKAKPAEAPASPEEEGKKDKKQLHPFVADILDGAGRKIKDKKLEFFHSLSLITLNSLEMYDDQSPRLLRVVYELKENKNRPFKDKKSYLLHRKETTDLYNVKAKAPEEKDQGAPVKTYLVADNIEFLSCEFFRNRNIPQKEKDKEAEKKVLHGFSWGKKEETASLLPEYVLITLSLWTEDYRTTARYECMVPLFVFDPPSLSSKKDEKPPEPAAQNPFGEEHKDLLENASKIADKLSDALMKSPLASPPEPTPGTP